MIRTFARTAQATLIAAAAIAATTLPSNAETFQIFRKGDWVVNFVSDRDPRLQYCEARTTNRDWVTIDLTYWGNDELKLYVHADEDAPYETRNVDLELRIDGETWDLTNAVLAGRDRGAVGFMITFNLTNHGQTAIRFLRDMQRSNTLRLIGYDGQTLARWSLHGSYASITALMDCAKKLN